MKQAHTSFTLVEMIVALAVLSILTVILFSVLNETSRAISLSSGRTAVYSDVPMVMDQFCREVQQAIRDDQYDCLTGSATEIHFIATIDNKAGADEVEVGYYFTGSSLTKTLHFRLINGTNDPYWNLNEARAGTFSNWWEDSPPLTNYISVLDNVKSFHLEYWTFFSPLYGPPYTNNWWNFSTQSRNTNRLPAYIQVVIGVCDPQDVVRYKGIANVPTSRIFTNFIYLPRQ